MTHKDLILSPFCFCETLSGNFAYAVGRIAFKPGRPMLVEHAGGLYLEHDLAGRVLTPGFGAAYDIAHVWRDHEPPPEMAA